MPVIPAPLREVIAALRRHYGKPAAPPSRRAFELVLCENVAYLAPPPRRQAAFALLKRSVGTAPEQILGATRTQLEVVTAHGILKTKFAAKLRDCARIARDAFDGDLETVLDTSLPQARRALRRFPGIGAPAADRILLFCGRLLSLAPESNGLRVLARLGVIAAHGSYARAYAAGVAAGAALPQRRVGLREAHQLLAEHGRTLCRLKAPLCGECPLQRVCAHARAAPRAA